MSSSIRRRIRNRALSAILRSPVKPTFEQLEERQLLSGTLLSSVTVPDVINTFEDQSRESVYDLDGDNTLSEGDVIHGFLRLDNRALPTPLNLGTGDLYLALAQEVKSVSVNVDGLGPGRNIYQYQLGAVDSAKAVSLGLRGHLCQCRCGHARAGPRRCSGGDDL